MGKRLDDLLAGNARAVQAGHAKPQSGERRPAAAVLSCTDERVVPQVIFDAPPGQLYMVRLAGNVFTPEVAGALEIAVLRLGCPLIVVLGHTDCTAVQMAHSRERIDGRAYEITRRIRPAIDGLPPTAPLIQAVEANVRHAVEEFRERDRLFRQMVGAGSLEISGVVYEIETGRIRSL